MTKTIYIPCHFETEFEKIQTNFTKLSLEDKPPDSTLNKLPNFDSTTKSRTF